MKKIVILISGKKGVGKTTLSNRLTDKLRDEFTIFETAFAKSLKDISNKVFADMDINTRDFTGERKEILRPIYQTIGNLGRTLDINYWVNKLVENVKSVNADITLVDDVRFPNEMKSFDNESDYQVFKFKVDRDSIFEGVDLDVSETSLDDYPLKNFDLILGKCVINDIDGIIKYIKDSIIEGE